MHVKKASRVSKALVCLLTFFASTPPVSADECCGPDSPFRMGEAYPDRPATCETARYWIDRAPVTDARVSFAIRGKLVAAEWDGALAYLVMCEEADVQVLCVTYSKDGKDVGDAVLFGGGYSRAGERRIMLDPCLASPVEQDAIP
jgi:hypothetical protein